MGASKEPHFLLQVLKLAFQINGKPLLHEIKVLLDQHSQPVNVLQVNYFTLNIMKVMVKFIIDYLESDEVLVNITSQRFEEKLTDLTRLYNANDFLKFLSVYAYKSVLEYLHSKVTSPICFFKAMLKCIEIVRGRHLSIEVFLDTLDEAAFAIVAEDQGIQHYKPLRDISIEFDLIEERKFILEVMNCIYDLHFKDMPEELEKILATLKSCDPKPKSGLNPIIKNALFVTMYHQSRRFKFLGDDKYLNMYYYNLSRNHFSEKNFLEFCVCWTRKSIDECYERFDIQYPMEAYKLLVKMLHIAKEDGKYQFISMMNEAANELVADDEDRIQYERARSDTHLVSPTSSLDTSTERTETSKKCNCCQLT